MPITPLMVVAGVVMMVTGAWMVRQVFVLTSYDPMDDGPMPSGRRMMHGTALWQCSVALVLITMDDWGATSNVIALLGAAAMAWFLPRCWDGSDLGHAEVPEEDLWDWLSLGDGGNDNAR